MNARTCSDSLSKGQPASGQRVESGQQFCRVTTEEGGGGGPGSGGPISMDKDEKRMRREIANSNERRRMQSINAGFQSLRQMLPHHEGEKLSKESREQRVLDGVI
ncbi:hypothetical protein pipiens_011456 [Culex pipiens pipiens]|uniref:BHLH domain-containing protein n=1 Tax=Culex pipiens pipiens TaxID=38569 RepID=A0ABD1D699_CULPP